MEFTNRERTEMFTVPTDERERLWVMGSVLEIIISGEQTGGEYAIGGEDGELVAEPGAVVHAPRGRLHWWRNVGSGPGRHLEIFVPAGLEKLFQEIGETVTDPNAPPSDPPDPGP